MNNKMKIWPGERKKLIKQAIADGRIVVKYEHGFPEGICEDCKQHRQLDPDHRLKRSQGGGHTKDNIDWVCRSCHDKRDNQGDPMKKKQTSTKKADWQKQHECAKCHRTISMLICPYCGKMGS